MFKNMPLNADALPFHPRNYICNICCQLEISSLAKPSNYIRNRDAIFVSTNSTVSSKNYTSCSVLNPYANIFKSKYKTYNNLAVITPNNGLDPCAKVFIPRINICNTNVPTPDGNFPDLHAICFDDSSPKEVLKKLKVDNPQKLIIGHLNINSVRHKFIPLKEIFGNSLDVFLISETKLNDTFPEGQFDITENQIIVNKRK